MSRQNQKGFTLIELLVIIAIIGLLASVVLVSLNSARQKSRDAKRLSDINMIAKAFEIYYSDCNAYPGAYSERPGNKVLLGSDKAIYSSNVSGTICDAGIAWRPTTGIVYLEQFPSAPTPADGNCTSDNNYIWRGLPSPQDSLQIDPQKYTITFCLGAATGGYSAGQRTLTESGIR